MTRPIPDLIPRAASSYFADRAGAYWQEKGDFARAIADYDEAIRLDPNDASAHRNRGAAWSEKHDFAQAIFDFTDAIRLDPEDNRGYRYRAQAWTQTKDFAKATSPTTTNRPP